MVGVVGKGHANLLEEQPLPRLIFHLARSALPEGDLDLEIGCHTIN